MPRLQRRQPVQRGQALRDDVRMRAEQVVGQGFPVRERQRPAASACVAEQRAQVGFELVRGVVVARDDQQRAVVRVGGARDGPRKRRRRSRRAPEGALLAGLGKGQRKMGRWQGAATSGARLSTRRRQLAQRVRGRSARVRRRLGCAWLQVQHHPHQAGRIGRLRGGSRATAPAPASAGCVRARRRRGGRASCLAPSAPAAASGGGPGPCRRCSG